MNLPLCAIECSGPRMHETCPSICGDASRVRPAFVGAAALRSLRRINLVAQWRQVVTVSEPRCLSIAFMHLQWGKLSPRPALNVFSVGLVSHSVVWNTGWSAFGFGPISSRFIRGRSSGKAAGLGLMPGVPTWDGARISAWAMLLFAEVSCVAKPGAVQIS